MPMTVGHKCPCGVAKRLSKPIPTCWAINALFKLLIDARGRETLPHEMLLLLPKRRDTLDTKLPLLMLKDAPRKVTAVAKRPCVLLALH